MLFEEMGFIGNVENQADVQNFSIEHMLQSRVGSPYSLAAMCESILRHSEIEVDLFRPYGPIRGTHLIMGLSNDSETFLDMSNGRLLTVEDCRRIVREKYGSYYMEETGEEHWSLQNDWALVGGSDFINDMSYDICWCYKQTMAQSNSRRLYFAKEKACKIMDMSCYSPARAIHSWCQKAHFLDPKVFCHYGLIDSDTMETYLAES